MIERNEKGQIKPGSGGRQKGATNKVSKQLRNKLLKLLDETYDQAKDELTKLEGKDFVKAWTDLLPYVVSRLQTTQLTEDISDLELPKFVWDDQLKQQPQKEE